MSALRCREGGAWGDEAQGDPTVTGAEAQRDASQKQYVFYVLFKFLIIINFILFFWGCAPLTYAPLAHII